MKHILYPTDFSENSEQALPFALEVARMFDSELTFLNTYQLPYSKSNLLVSIKDRMKQDSEGGLKALKEKALSRDKYKNLNIKLESLPGGFVSSIPKFAHSCSSNLIVMGTKGASGLKEMFIGSNTLEVIQSTNCPVLAIPENAKMKTLRKISYATDFREIKNPEALNPLFEIARKLDLPLEFVNVIRSQDEGIGEYKAKQAKILEDLAGDIRCSIFFISNDDIIDGISEYINEVKPDLFAMLSRKHTLFERIFTKSITNQLSFRSEIPLLVLDE